MTPTPTLDRQRTDQLRAFLTVEAAADAARRRPVLTPARRRVLAGATAVLVLGGGLVAAQAVGGPAPAAIAVEVDGAWTTVRLVDIDADPDAVVEQLRDAGFTAERQTHEVDRDGDGRTTMTHDATGTGPGAGIVALHEGEGGEHGLVGLSVSLPEGAVPSSQSTAGDDGPGTPIGGTFEGSGGGPSGARPATPAERPVADDAMADAGVRFEEDGGVSLRAGADVTIVVYTEA